MSTPHAPDLTSYPKLTVDGTEYEVRLDIFDLIALEKQGVDLLRATDYDSPGLDGNHPSLIERSLKILAQGIHATRTIQRDDKTATVPITWDYLAKNLGMEGILSVIPKTTEAVKKVRAQISGGSVPVAEKPLVQ